SDAHPLGSGDRPILAVLLPGATTRPCFQGSPGRQTEFGVGRVIRGRVPWGTFNLEGRPGRFAGGRRRGSSGHMKRPEPALLGRLHTVTSHPVAHTWRATRKLPCASTRCSAVSEPSAPHPGSSRTAREHLDAAMN